MKKYFYILFLVLAGLGAKAQEPAKIQERMREYVQDRLNLSRAEAEKFTPVFVRYFRDFKQTHQLYQKDPLIMKQKLIELRINYRTEFRQVIDPEKANQVYKYEDEFRREAIQIIKENRENRKDVLPNKRNRQDR